MGYTRDLIQDRLSSIQEELERIENEKKHIEGQLEEYTVQQEKLKHIELDLTKSLSIIGREQTN